MSAILFIGSESYDAATITILQGLDELEYTIYTIDKPNINSWWCNKVIANPKTVKFDFVLSNLHWGTRWDYYQKFELQKHLKVLIDGDDAVKGYTHWRDKHKVYSSVYKTYPVESVLQRELQPYRWMMPLGDYSPDIRFVSQKAYGDEAYYLPFGINFNYLQFAQGKSTDQRIIDFTNIPSRAGTERLKLTEFLQTPHLPGCVHNDYAIGDKISPPALKYVNQDTNIHSYHRWTTSVEYYRLLNDTKVYIEPGVFGDRPHWDSKRPWEALASGCFVLFHKPPVDMEQYPVTELCGDFSIFDTFEEMVEKCHYLYDNPIQLDKLRVETERKALEQFTPVPLAKYFLRCIKER